MRSPFSLLERTPLGSARPALPKWQPTPLLSLGGIAAALLACGFFPPSLHGADAPSPSPVTVSGSYTAEVLTVASGGIRQGSAFRGLAEADVQADLAALGAREGTVFHLSVLGPSGSDVSARYLGDLQGASNITTYNHLLLYELSLAGRFAGGRVDLKVGRLLADCEFAVTDSSAALLNSSFGWPTFISANTRNTGPAFDRSALGVHAGVKLSPTLRFQAGVYDGDTFDSPNGDPSRYADGLSFRLSRSQGAFGIAELDLTPHPAQAESAPVASVKLGVWAHTADFADQCVASRCHHGNGGIYAAGELPLWSQAGVADQPGRHLTAFARAGVCPSDRDRVSQAAEAGLCAAGIVPGRGLDLLSLGLAYAGIGGYARQAERNCGVLNPSDYELALEANYQFCLGSRFQVVPDLQWIHHPGASPLQKDALVYGLRTQVTF